MDIADVFRLLLDPTFSNKLGEHINIKWGIETIRNIQMWQPRN